MMNLSIKKNSIIVDSYSIVLEIKAENLLEEILSPFLTLFQIPVIVSSAIENPMAITIPLIGKKKLNNNENNFILCNLVCAINKLN